MEQKPILQFQYEMDGDKIVLRNDEGVIWCPPATKMERSAVHPLTKSPAR